MKLIWRKMTLLGLGTFFLATSCWSGKSFPIGDKTPVTNATLTSSSPTVHPIDTPSAASTVSPAGKSVTPRPSLSATPTMTITHNLTPPPADVLITPRQFGEPVVVSVGQTIALLPPGEGEWQVDYDMSLILSLTPSEKMHAPGSQGWLFKAIKPGQTEIALTGVPAPCNQPQPCPPAVPRLIVTLKIQK